MAQVRDILADVKKIDAIESNVSTLQTDLGTFDPYPAQASQSGKFLTTDGTNVSWASVDAYDQSLNTTDNVTFNQISSANDLALGTSAASAFTSIDMQNTTGWFYITQGTNGTYLTSVPDADQAFRIQNANGDIRLEPSSGKSVVATSDITTTGDVKASTVEVSQPFFVNSQTVTADFAIPSGSSAMAAGPITVGTGVTVTIPSGSRWVIV